MYANREVTLMFKIMAELAPQLSWSHYWLPVGNSDKFNRLSSKIPYRHAIQDLGNR